MIETMNKNTLTLILKHYLFFVFIPAGLAALFGYLGFQALPTILVDFIVFLSPFVFFIATYRKSAKNVKSKPMLILFSFIIPCLFTGYIYIILSAVSKLII